MAVTKFRHTGSIGDVWASIPAMNQSYKITGKKIELYLVPNILADYYEGAIHPTKSEDGFQVTLNKQVIQMMIPLLNEQPFIDSVIIGEPEGMFVDLAAIRSPYEWMPKFSINRWYFYIFPDLACDLSGVWLNVPDSEKDLAKGKILITRTERYTNPKINYEFLKQYEDDLLFCGTMREYNNFCMQNDLNIKKLNISNFLEQAQAIKQCKFHITNQTQAFQLSEGQKVPRILELCHFAPNCIPIGENAYDFFAQVALESYFHKLNGGYEEYHNKLRDGKSLGGSNKWEV